MADTRRCNIGLIFSARVSVDTVLLTDSLRDRDVTSGVRERGKNNNGVETKQTTMEIQTDPSHQAPIHSGSTGVRWVAWKRMENMQIDKQFINEHYN